MESANFQLPIYFLFKFLGNNIVVQAKLQLAEKRMKY